MITEHHCVCVGKTGKAGKAGTWSETACCLCVWLSVCLCVCVSVCNNNWRSQVRRAPEVKQHVVGVTVGVGLTGSVAAGSYILQPHQYTNQSSEIGFDPWAGFTTSKTNSNCDWECMYTGHLQPTVLLLWETNLQLNNPCYEYDSCKAWERMASNVTQ